MGAADISDRVGDAYGCFSNYAPVRLHDGTYSLTMWQGAEGKVIIRSLKDPFNGNLGNPNTILIYYDLRGNRYPIFKVGDLLKSQDKISSSYDPKPEAYEDNLLGLLAERIAWRNTQVWLSSLDGKLQEDPYEEEHIFANTDNYILKVKNSPNLLLLRKEDDYPSSYMPQKELDGLFIYNKDRENYVLVLETKIQGMDVDPDNLINKLFRPLKEIYPSYKQIYIMYTDQSTIYSAGSDRKNRKHTANSLKKKPLHLYKKLLEHDIGTIYFGFRERSKQFKDMGTHVFNYVKLTENLPVNVTATITQDKMVLWGLESPLLILKKNEEGTWSQIPVRR